MPRKPLKPLKRTSKLKSMPQVLPGNSTPAVVTSAQVIPSVPAQVERLAPTPDNMLMVAVQSNRSIEEISKFMELYEKWEKEKTRKAFMSDKAKFQREAKSVTKNKDADFGETRSGKEGAKYKFSSLGNTGDEIREPLHGNNFTYDWDVEQVYEKDIEKIKVTCILTHADGFEKKVTVKAPDDRSGGKNAVQGIGSTLTYLKRQTLELVVGITLIDDDDDGHGAGHPGEGTDNPRATEVEFNMAISNLKQGRANAQEIAEYYTLTPEQKKRLEIEVANLPKS